VNRASTPSRPPAAHPYAALFEPARIGRLVVKNKFAMAPMGPLGFADQFGGWNRRGVEYYVTRARGGVGLIITGVTFAESPAERMPQPIVPSSVRSPGHFLQTSRELTERVHAYDAKIMLQISAGFGRVVMPNSSPPGQAPAAPSAIPHRWSEAMCREMTVSEIRATVTNIAQGAAVAQRAGFDGIQIHAVHEGYLLDQFAIEMFNHRVDAYGGSLENRLRFAREIVEAIKERCGDDYPVTLRYSPKSMIKDWRVGALPGEQFLEMGRDLPEGIEAGRLLVSYGYDALDIDVGSYDSWYWSHPPMYQEKGLYLPYSKPVKQAIGEVPVILAGRMDDPDLATRALTEGYADLISLGRPLLADPDYVNKLFSGHEDLIRPCLSCQEGCMGRIQEYLSINCAVNPETGREADTRLVPALHPKQVMIVGGGVAGMEAARVLALRGHRPVLYEASHRLGGVVVAGGQPPFKSDDLALIAWYEATLRDLNVEVHLGTRVTAEMVKASGAEHLLVATGARPRTIDLGSALPVIEAVDALLDPAALTGRRVAIVGGGLTGCELALYLRELDGDTEVTIVEMGSDLLTLSGPLCHANHDMLHDLVRYRGTRVVANAVAEHTTTEGLVVRQHGAEQLIAADIVVSAIGYVSDPTLFDAVRHLPIGKHLLGDARTVSNIMYAIWGAYEVAASV
jgi:2-enoate reductase